MNGAEKSMGKKSFFWKKHEEINEKEEQKQQSSVNSFIEDNVTLAANSHTMARHADASTEYFKAYSGKNYQANGLLKEDMQKSLKGISAGKVTDGDRNIKQQAGYSAEVMEVANRNATEKLKGSDTRYSRADDVNGHKINETKNDIVKLDKNGNEVLGPDGHVQGSQMKFVAMGKSADETMSKLLSSEYRQKYPDGNFCVAKDKYDGVMDSLQKKEIELQKQIDRLEKNGNTELASKKKDELDYVKKVKNNLEKSNVTEKEAIFARKHPELWTAGKVVEMSHDAGVQCAKSSAAISFVSSFARNLTGYLSGDIDEETALKNLAKDTAKAAASGYVTGFANTAISSALQSSSNEIIRNFVTKYPNSPAYVVSFMTQTFSVIGRRMKGEITDEQCFREIGKNALVMGGSIAGKAIGSKIGIAIGTKVGGAFGAVLGPIGAMVGSFVGSVIVSTAVDVIGKELEGISRAKNLLKEQKQRLEEAKAKYENLCKELDEYDRIFRETYIAHTEELRAVLGESIMGMANALKLKDADAFIANTNNITLALGQKPQFNTVNEFKSMVENKVPLEL